jgi:predicted adenylyl cyclase CyaB
LGAVEGSKKIENNIYFDDFLGELSDRGKTLRLRVSSGTEGKSISLTYKGKKTGKIIFKRKEITLYLKEEAEAEELLKNIGYIKTFSYEKRRDTWSYKGCLIELDTLPIIGCFVEVEGPAESVIKKVSKELQLPNTYISDGYKTIVSKYLAVKRYPILGEGRKNKLQFK